MTTLISGQLGKAVLVPDDTHVLDDGCVLIDVDENIAPAKASFSSIRLLFAGAEDLQQSSATLVDDIRGELRIEWQKDQALLLTLTVIDPELDNNLKVESVALANELMARDDISLFVRFMLHSKPIREADLAHARAVATKGSRLDSILSCVIENRNAISAVAQQWDGLHDELFESSNENQVIRRCCARSGAFYHLANSLRANDADDYDTARSAATLALREYPRGLEIIAQWADPLKPQEKHMGAIGDRAALPNLATVTSPNPVEMLSQVQLAELQAALAILGYPVGDIDGLIGPRTRNAWAEYKSDVFPGNPQLIGAESIDRLRQDLLKLAAWETANFGSKQGTIDAIRGMCQAMGIGLPTQIAYVLATTQWETAQTFQPVKEAFWLDEAWREANLSYYPYYGRGYVQLTWDKNYKAYSDILAIDLVGNPDRALDPTVALFVLVHGFKTGTFTGRKITDFITQGMTDFVGARRCVNGTDKANEIASLAEQFLAAEPAAGSGPMAAAPAAIAAPAPAAIAAPAPTAVSRAVPVAPSDGATDPMIERLSLRQIARAAAYELKRLHPVVVFTSGRRDKAGQARAMAENSVGNPNWISQTYAPNKASQACQQWVLNNPQATTAQQIAAGLLSTMNALTDTELGQMSRHLSGDAFDIQPLEPDNAGIKDTIRALPGLRLFLDREGGLVRWHAEFNA